MKTILITAILLLGSITFGQTDVAHAMVSVTDFSDNPIGGAQIQFFDTDRNKTLSATSGTDGKFEIDLAQGVYNIRLKSVGKTRDYQLIEIPKLKEGQEYGEVQIVIQYEEETTFTLSNLHFETNKSVIKPDSFDELDELVKYLNLKPELNIEIAGHTDSEGSDDSNLSLSQRRANAVKTYLANKGIDAKRLTANGYGENSPIADNNSESGKALNRRTEIHIIK